MPRKVVILEATPRGEYVAKLVTQPCPGEDPFDADGAAVFRLHARRALGDAGLVAHSRAVRWAEQLGVPYID